MDRTNSFRTRRTSKDVLRSMLSNRSHLNLSGEIHFGEPVLKAHGGFCDVFQGSWISQGVCIYKVAIKRLRAHIQSDSDFAKQLAKEIRVWSGLYHRNVLPLLGYVIEGEYPSLISEWMDNGTVSRYMRENPRTDLLQMILGIARGLEYIHEKGVIHSDIKADNVLVSRFGEPIICDFGISRIISASQSFGETSGHRVKGSVRWMARELLADPQSVHSKESDVWAFGMTIYELLADQIPFNDIKRDVQVMFTILQGYTPARPKAFTDWPVYWQKLWSICFVSWNRYPQLRKPMSEIVSYLELLCRHAEEEHGTRSGKKSPQVIEALDDSGYRQASILGHDEYEQPAEYPSNSCSSPIKRDLNDEHSDGRDGSEYYLLTATNRISPIKRANVRYSRNRIRAPSLGNESVIRDFDLRQSSSSVSASPEKVRLPRTEERLDLISKWQETLKLKPVATVNEPPCNAALDSLSPTTCYKHAHASSRRSLSSSVGSSTIVASTENHYSTIEINNSEAIPKPKVLRRRTGTVSRIKQAAVI